MTTEAAPPQSVSSPQRVPRPDRHLSQLSKDRLKRIAALAVLSGLGVVFFGAPSHARSEARRLQIAKASFNRDLKHASPAGKFALQFLDTKDSDYGIKDTSPGKGLRGFFTFIMSGGSEDYKVGSDCLARTTYDLYGDGQASAATAFVDPENPNLLTVSPPPNGQVLHFSGFEGGALAPADPTTTAVLATYGCPAEPKPVKVEPDY